MNLTFLLQIVDAMANGQLATTSCHHQNGSCDSVLRVQSTSRNLRAFDGRRSRVWTNDGDPRKGNSCVSHHFHTSSVRLMQKLSSAHPTSAWFAVCAPDQPCITPGTYAFLGAAAALGYVKRLRYLSGADLAPL
jgi:hypothetical protein